MRSLRNVLLFSMFVAGSMGNNSVFAVTQNVFLDFDSGVSGNINYTQQMRDDVTAGIQLIFEDFDIEVFQTAPAAPFSRIRFNQGSPGGLAEQIDFRNLDNSDNGVVNVSGLGLSGTQAFVGASITIGAHELGHLLGFRHGDSFGPIGSGLGLPGPGPGPYNPNYPGPSGGVEIVSNVMGTPALGVPLSTVVNQHWLSERSATKMAFAESGTVLPEAPGAKNTLATAQPINLDGIVVPNTIVNGANAGLNDFSVEAITVTGNISAANEMDLYEFSASAGDLLNVEVLSRIIDQRISNTIDSEVALLDSQGNFVDYYGTNAFNDDELETNDSILLDLVIPDDGTYYLQVNAFSSNDTGGYELFAYIFNGEITTSGDFNGDGDYACDDVDALVAEIVNGTNGGQFDLTSDGLVNGDDLDAWLAEAGAAELASGNPYLYGDADLGGTVDGVDFMVWNDNKFAASGGWCSGDFNADGFTDGVDFTIWNNNKFQSADAVIGVPEPASCAWFVVVAAMLFSRRRS